MSNRSRVWEKSNNKIIILEEYVKTIYGDSRSLYDIYLDAAHGRIRLLDPSPPKNYREYLRRLDYSLWVYLVMVIVAVELALVLTETRNAVRLATGIVFTTFLPGYALIQLLYASKELQPLEVLAMSFATSLAIITLIGLFLNYSYLGLQERPFIIINSIIIIIFTLLSSFRKYKLIKI